MPTMTKSCCKRMAMRWRAKPSNSAIVKEALLVLEDRHDSRLDAIFIPQLPISFPHTSIRRADKSVDRNEGRLRSCPYSRFSGT